MRSFKISIFIFLFSLLIAQKNDEYEGTIKQNTILFKLKPELRGRPFSERKRYWDKEFNSGKKLSYPVTIRSLPLGAEVYVDGAFAGNTPIYGLKVGHGRHQYTIKKEGYKDVSNSFYTPPGDVVVFEALKLGSNKKFRQKKLDINAESKKESKMNIPPIYTGTIEQNLILFEKRPDLKGKAFSFRLLAWEKLNDPNSSKPSSFDNKLNNSSLKEENNRRMNSYTKSKDSNPRANYFEEKETKLLRSSYAKERKKNKFSFKEFFLWGAGSAGSYTLMKNGYVVLGRNVLLSLATRKIVRDFLSGYSNNHNRLNVWLEYYPNGYYEPQKQIFLGEKGRLELKIINSSSKSVRNISPNLKIHRINQYYRREMPKMSGIRQISGGKKSINGKYHLGPKEKMIVSYDLEMPMIFDFNKIEFIGDASEKISSKAKVVKFSLMETQEPPKMILVIDDLIDDDGNGILDGLESALITGYVENLGSGPAIQVRVKIENKPKYIQITKDELNLKNILPGEKNIFKFELKGMQELESGIEKINFSSIDIKGNEAPPKTATINTSKFFPPDLKIVNWSVNDGQMGMANGNGNNLVENGEMVEIILNVKNIGHGPSYGTTSSISLKSNGVFPIKEKQYIGSIAPGTVVEVPIGFTVSKSFNKEKFTFNIKMDDERRSFNYLDKITVSCNYRYPRLSFDYIVHDGTSPGSEGNSNGLMDQGEKIELEVIASNNGDLEASDVTLSVISNNPGVKIKNMPRGNFNDYISIGDIPARTTSRSIYVPIQIRYSASVGLFNLRISMEQSIFENLEEIINMEIYRHVGDEVSLGANSSFGFGKNKNYDSKDLYINVDNSPYYENNMSHGFAVVIGNRNYEDNDIPNVDYAHRDSRTFKSYLINSFGIPNDNIIDIRDGNLSDFNRLFGTKDNKKGQLYKQIKRIGKKSKVFVFYSGHGAPDLNNKNAYIVPSESTINNIEFEGYLLDQLFENLASLPSDDITLILDACFSGKSGGGGFLYKGISPALLQVNNPNIIKGLNVFSSSRNDEVSSWFPKARHGIFTYFFLAGLQGYADSNKDKKSQMKKCLIIYLKLYRKR